MSPLRLYRWLCALVCIASAATTSRAWAEIDFEPSWTPAPYEDVRVEIYDWLGQAEVSDEIAGKIKELWPSRAPKPADDMPVLDRAVRSFGMAYPDAEELIERCAAPFKSPTLPDVEWIAEAKMPNLAKANLRLYYARWLAQSGLYDEVLEQIADLRPGEVVDPAALLFYQMAAYHQLVMPDESRIALVQLLEREHDLPQRFRQVAELVKRDLGGLEDESLNHIARRMRDVRRRLDYGRAGQKIQAVEKGVLDSLDKKIKDLEEQCKNQQQSSASSGGSSQSSRPMDDSRPAELKAPMQVDRKDIGRQSGWGDLPPKEREQALQQIGREFPAHYRELIEGYFRELAAESPAPSETP